jgi:hypothetical protein
MNNWSTRTLLLSLLLTVFTACASESNGVNEIGGTFTKAADELGSSLSKLSPSGRFDDPSIAKIGANARILIFLTSNKENTSFLINDVQQPPAKLLRVLVPEADLRIVAKTDCYRPLEQFATAGSFSDGSQFSFTFGDWDLLNGNSSIAKMGRCT